MPYKDAEKRKQANREAMRRARRGTQETGSRGTQASETVDPYVYPSAVRCWHCGAHHATVQDARDCQLETPEGHACATFGMSPWALRPDKRALPDLKAISDSLAKGKLGHKVRFGVEGPTFEEIARVL